MAGLSGLIVIGPINTRHGVVYSQDSPRRTELNLLLSSPPWTPPGDSLSFIYKTTASRNFEASRRACLGVDSKLSASSTARPGGGLPKPRPSRSRESPHCLACSGRTGAASFIATTFGQPRLESLDFSTHAQHNTGCFLFLFLVSLLYDH